MAIQEYPEFMVSGAPAIYSIGAVAAMVGTPTATLRTWEDRYGVVVPTRSGGGHRLYSRDQVEHLRFIADRMAEGLSAADAHRLLSGRLEGNQGPGSGDMEGTAKLLILLAERDLHAADFAEYFLRTEGYQVLGVKDAEDVPRQLMDAQADLAVIDLLISGGRGLEICRELALEGMPVLAISTLDMQDQALEAGAGAFLLKPLDPLQLVSAVRDLLRQSAYLRGRQ